MSEKRTSKRTTVRHSLERNLEHLKSSKDKIDLNNRHGVCHGSARTFYDLGYLSAPDYRNYLWEVNQTFSEMELRLPEKYTTNYAV